MTDHKHCLDPNCPPACAENCCAQEESANQPSERRPKVGDRVRVQGGPGYEFRPAKVTYVTEVAFDVLPDGERFPWFPYLFRDHGITWDFADEPAKQPVRDATIRRDAIPDMPEEHGTMCGFAWLGRPDWPWSGCLKSDWLKLRDFLAAKAYERVRSACATTRRLYSELKMRAEQERDEALANSREEHERLVRLGVLLDEAIRVRDGYKDSNESAMRAWGDARADVDRLTARNAELVAEVQAAKAQTTRIEAVFTRVWEIVTKWRTDRAHMTSPEAMGLIAWAMEIPDAEAAGKQTAPVPATGTGITPHMVEAAKAESQWEAFAESLERLASESLSPAARAWLRGKAAGK